jgi:hypothetical protein
MNDILVKIYVILTTVLFICSAIVWSRNNFLNLFVKILLTLFAIFGLILALQACGVLVINMGG